MFAAASFALADLVTASEAVAAIVIGIVALIDTVKIITEIVRGVGK